MRSSRVNAGPWAWPAWARYPGVQSSPLAPFRPLLSEVADACLERGPAETERLLGTRTELLTSIEPALASLPHRSRAAADPNPGDALGPRLVEALVETLAAFARGRRLVLVLDDLQWADELTLGVLAQVHSGARTPPGVAVVAAYRAEDEQGVMARLRRSCASATVVDLGPIVDDGLVEIIGDMLGTREVEPRSLPGARQPRAGKPLLRRGVPPSRDGRGSLAASRHGRWELGEAGADASERTGLPRPGSLHELIARRLDALPSDAARLLDLAAVFGREVEAELLEAVGLMDEPRLMTSLKILLAAQLLEEPEAGQFVFLHDKLREVAYARIPVEGRRELHMRAAVAIEARRDLASPDPATEAILAHHWSRSVGDPATQPDRTEKALHYLKLALDQAVRSGLAREAIEFGQVAARLLGVALPETPEALEGRSAARWRNFNGGWPVVTRPSFSTSPTLTTRGPTRRSACSLQCFLPLT